MDSIWAPTTPAQQIKEKTPGRPAVAYPNDAADGGNAGKAAHARHQVFPDEDHGQAEPEQGQGGADAAGIRLGGVAGGVSPAHVGGGQGGENHQRAVPAAGSGEIPGVFDVAASPQPHDHQQQYIRNDNSRIQPHKAFLPPTDSSLAYITLCACLRDYVRRPGRPLIGFPAPNRQILLC